MTTTIAQNYRMNVVMAGHVDHGKSTVIGRLLADTNSLPEGKLEQVRLMCERNARPFEYAFLLDALKDERSQGITIDTARCFFKTDRRHYILIDAPGHIEFLKNMITGAARAEAGLIVIDAHEGIQENSKRHGYMVSMLGLRQIAVVVNKMDLIDYDQERFEAIQRNFTEFLAKIGVHPLGFIPASGSQGTNIAARDERTDWYKGPTVLEQIDAFVEEGAPTELPFRLPVQDIYKFTEEDDSRRIVAGTITTGQIHVGDDVVFLPSHKGSQVKSIESFNTNTRADAQAGEAVGVTLTTQIYARRGELMVRADEPAPQVSRRFKVNLFWMGTAPMVKNKAYKVKLGASRSTIQLVDILNVLDASELSSVSNKQQVDRHDVAECVLECPKPLAFDLNESIEATGRLVIIDNYEIAGAGILLETIEDDQSMLKDHIRDREMEWKGSSIRADERTAVYNHGAKFVLITGDDGVGKEILAHALERKLFYANFKAYYLELGDVMSGLDADIGDESRDEHLRRLGELARILTDSGQIFITSLSHVDDYDLEMLELLNKPNEIVVVHVGDNSFNTYAPSMVLPESPDPDEWVKKICDMLREKKVILQYSI